MKTIFILGTVFISVIGTLLHFVFEFSKHNKIVAFFGAVNESTWEHIKIALTPYFLWSLVDGFMYGTNQNYFLAKVVGMVAIIIIIPLIFYGYSKILKKTILVFNILTFYIAIVLGQYFSYLIMNIKEVPYFITYISLVLLFILFGFYMVSTIMPIKSFLFKDPITNKYGLKGHSHSKEKNK